MSTAVGTLGQAPSGGVSIARVELFEWNYVAILLSGACCVTTEKRRQEFLAKAKEAQTKAENAQDVGAKAAWLKVAEMYREMARLER
jgi:hypothetical protein